MTKTHHLLGPSSAPRWLNCIGSVIPKSPYVPAGDAAKEGTACHELLEAALMGIDPNTMLGTMIPVEGKQFEVTQEMIDGVDLFLETVDGLVAEFGLDKSLLRSEQYFTAHPLFGGTCDFYLFQNNRLIVIDFKYGRKPVSARSEQLTCYAALIIGALGTTVPIEVIQLVVQPRSIGEKVTRYSPTQDEIGLLVQRILESIRIVEENAGATESPLHLLNVGSHCEYCPKQNGCPAHMKMMEQLVIDVQTPQVFLNEESAIPSLLYWVELEDAIKGFFKNINSALLSHAEAGRPIPGKKLVPRYGNRQIALDEKFTVSKFVSWFTRTFKETGVKAKDLKVSSLKSPAQLEAVLKEHKALDKTAKSKLAEKVRREVTGVKLVDASDRGDAVDPLHIPAFLKAIEESQNE